jgi:DNA-binding PadR family transcriptional regulator
MADDGGRGWRDPGLLILISLAGGPRHGFGMLEDIERFSGRRLGPGTLYGALERLERDGLIEPLEADDRRRPYRLSQHGSRLLDEQLGGLQRLTEVAAARRNQSRATGR